MTIQLIKKLLPMLALSAATYATPLAHSALLPDLHLHGYEATETTEVTEMHSQWLAGATAAAKQFGCTKVAVEQQPNETIAEAVKLFGLVATEGSCWCSRLSQRIRGLCATPSPEGERSTGSIFSTFLTRAQLRCGTALS